MQEGGYTIMLSTCRPRSVVPPILEKETHTVTHKYTGKHSDVLGKETTSLQWRNFAVNMQDNKIDMSYLSILLGSWDIIPI